ncbi:hypothetical protein ABEV34_10180 [Methylorubrum rhodesianum]|jgi:hypothetical protein|uniref:hypothetical protein n=1 Tax=Methylorubrum TaxID=2282523 RepID=UPI00129CC5A0|nr:MULTISPECIES: hypothetical protein [Methylorubrum]MBB5761362.1 hypothetical protein [Methylorubrum rhodesianum]MBI1687260.1 hypothetical protein [Methylorubrum sp. DB1722]MRI55083.1 hypothetical protein [Methylobacterium sp. DB1607]
MADDTDRLGLLVGVFELALNRLFEASPEGGQARDRFVEDVRRLLADTRELQADSPAAQTYEALLRRLGATHPGDADGLGVVPTPEQGVPPVGSGV